MTRATLRGFDTLQPAMEAALCHDIGGLFLMTIEAQPRLMTAVAAIVAKRALLLVFLMRGAQLSRHEQCLRIDGFTAPDRRQT